VEGFPSHLDVHAPPPEPLSPPGTPPPCIDSPGALSPLFYYDVASAHPNLSRDRGLLAHSDSPPRSFKTIFFLVLPMSQWKSGVFKTRSPPSPKLPSIRRFGFARRTPLRSRLLGTPVHYSAKAVTMTKLFSEQIRPCTPPYKRHPLCLDPGIPLVILDSFPSRSFSVTFPCVDYSRLLEEKFRFGKTVVSPSLSAGKRYARSGPLPFVPHFSLGTVFGVP